MSNISNDRLYESIFEQVCEEADAYNWNGESIEAKELWIIKEVRKRRWGLHD